MDINRILNTVRIPEDAGEHREGLGRILNKIPDGWGRWISCGRGWYPIIVKLDQQLEQLMPGYEVEQVKEKFGTLRYYYALPVTEAPYNKEHPEPGAEDDKAWAAWYKGWQNWIDSPEGKAYTNSQDKLLSQANQLIQKAESESAQTCEACGAPGETRNNAGWLRTLCDSCRQPSA